MAKKKKKQEATPEEKAWQEAGIRAFEKLQAELVKKKSGLDRVALRLSQGLNARRTLFFQHEGEVTDERTVIDYGERRKYAELAISVFGAKAPEKHEVGGPEGGPIEINLKWPENGNGINGKTS